MPAERVVLIRPRTVLSVAGILVALALVLEIVYAARHVLTWVAVALFLALALDPAVRWMQAHTPIRSRGAATGVIYLLFLAALTGIGYLLLAPLVHQVQGLADALPGYAHDLTAGRGPLGFLETRYHVVEKVRNATSGGGSTFTHGAATALAITKGVLTTIAGIVTVAFLTFFMVLEGPAWVERGLALAPPARRPRWRRVGQRIAQTVSGYVTGNLLISVIAGTASALVLVACGVPYALALGLLVAILDLIPLAGATLAGIVIVTVAALTSITAGVIVAVFFIVYQQIENHLLQPLVYGRTVQLSPLTVLISVLIGGEIAGVLGALGAIPVAGSLQIVLHEWRDAGSGPADVPADDGRTAASGSLASTPGAPHA
jgi:predicted PurR-regulated permease PerM